MTTVYVLTGKNCPACETMKRQLKHSGIDYTEIDRESDTGRRWTAKYHLLSIPVVILWSEHDAPHIFPAGTVKIAAIRSLLRRMG